MTLVRLKLRELASWEQRQEIKLTPQNLHCYCNCYKSNIALRSGDCSKLASSGTEIFAKFSPHILKWGRGSDQLILLITQSNFPLLKMWLKFVHLLLISHQYCSVELSVLFATCRFIMLASKRISHNDSGRHQNTIFSGRTHPIIFSCCAAECS